MELPIQLDLTDMAESLSFQPYDRVIEFIERIDEFVADSEFTTRLIQRLEDTLADDIVEVDID